MLQHVSPIPLAIPTKATYYLFNGAMKALGLPISLWVVSRAHGSFAIQQFHQTLPELAGELGVTIRDDRARHAKCANPMVKQQTCNLRCISIRTNRQKFYILTKPINNAKYSCTTIRKWQMRHKIHTNGLKASVRYR